MTGENRKTSIVIIGGSVAGLSAATRARRINELAEITIFDESGNIGYSMPALPAFASGNISKKESLYSDEEEKLADIYNIRLQKGFKAVEIDRKNKAVKVRNISNEKMADISYDRLILACGSKINLPKIAGSGALNIFTLRNIEDAIKIREYINRTAIKSVTIVGANYYGLLAVNEFIKKGFEVTVIEEKKKFIGDLDNEFNFFMKNELEKNGVSVHTDVTISKLVKENKEAVNKIELSNKKVINTQILIFFSALSPNTELASKAGLEIGPTGRIKVNGKMQTSDPDIFAAGNIAETFNFITKQPDNSPLIGPAQFQGRVAGTVAAGGDMNYTGITGTMLMKFLDFTVGMTGIGHEKAKKLGYPAFSHTVYSGNHERFVPAADQLHLKVIVNESNRKILGAQVFGRGHSVDKKLDVLATSIYAGLVVDDLINLNLSYSPELNTAKDPINVLGMVCANRLDGLSKPVQIDDIVLSEKVYILDVRNKKDYLKSHIEHSFWIPINELRSRLDEIPKDMDIYIYGHNGLRGYVAERILRGSGFERVYNIEGGLTSVKISESMTASC